jgi:hypothetical protein
MRSVVIIRRVAATLLLLFASYEAAAAQAPSGPVVVRSPNSSAFQVWIVDPGTGVAAFYGGDIVAICREEPDAHDLLDMTEVYDPQDLAMVFAAQGKDIGASLWDRAPPFNARLCQDILARGAPLATGTADVTSTGRFPQTWADPDVMGVYGLTAQGTMTTPQGETLRVNGHWRCQGRAPESRCTQGLVVNRR